MPLEGAVGPGCPNRPVDVRIVQILLNANRQSFPLDAELAEDGLYGSKTWRGIVAYQAASGQAEPPGILEPGAPELRDLVAGLAPGLSEDRLCCIMATSKRSRVAPFRDALIQAMAEADISTPLRQAHFLAQVGHESGGFLWTEELASGEAYEGRSDLGNSQPGDGPRFKGRGLIQLTGRANYTEFSRFVGEDLTDDAGARRVADEPRLCVLAATWFWQSRGLNGLADADDLRAVTRRVNGGFNGLDDRAAYLRRAKAMLT